MDFETCKICGRFFQLSGNGLFHHATIKHRDQLHLFSSRKAQASKSLPANAVLIPNHNVKQASSSSIPALSSSHSYGRRSTRKKVVEVEEVMKTQKSDVSFKSEIKGVLESISATYGPPDDDEDTSVKFGDVMMNLSTLLVSNHQASPNYENEDPEHFKSLQIVTLTEFTTFMCERYDLIEMPSLAFEAALFRAISIEIQDFLYMQLFKEDSLAEQQYIFPKSEVLNHLILRYAVKLIRSCEHLEDVLEDYEILLIFECIVDSIANDAATVEFLDNFSVNEASLLKYLKMVILRSSGSVFNPSYSTHERMSEILRFRYVWSLTTLLRSARLVSSLDLQAFTGNIVAMLKELENDIEQIGSGFSLPHIKSSRVYLVCKSSISLAMVETSNHSALSRLESKIVSINTKNSDRPDAFDDMKEWLKESYLLIQTIGDPLLLWGNNIANSIFGHALHVACKLTDREILSRLFMDISILTSRKYKANPSIWRKQVDEVFSMMGCALQSLGDEAVRNEIMEQPLSHAISIWLLAYDTQDITLFSTLTAFLNTFNFLEIEVPEVCMQTALISVLEDAARSLDATRLDFIRVLLPLATSLLRLPSSAMKVTYSSVCTIVADLQHHFGNAHESSSSRMTQLRCIEGIYHLILHLLIKSIGVVERDWLGDVCKLISACYNEYIDLHLIELDDWAFMLNISRQLISLIPECNGCAIECDGMTTVENFSKDQLMQIIDILCELYSDAYGLPFVTNDTAVSAIENGPHLEVDDNNLPEIFTFLKYTETKGFLGKTELRQLYNSLYCKSVLKDFALSDCSPRLERHLFASIERDDFDWVEFQDLLKCADERGQSHGSVSNNFVAMKVFKTIEEVRQRFYWNLLRLGVTENPPSRVGTSSSAGEENVLTRLTKYETMALPLINALLLDIGHNPLHFRSWCQLMRELASFYFFILDLQCELIVVDEISVDMHEGDREDRCSHDFLQPTKLSITPENIVPTCIIKKNQILTLMFRVVCSMEKVYSYCNLGADENDDHGLFGTFENFGNVLYSTSLQFSKGSSGRKEYCERAFTYYKKAAEGFEKLEISGFTYMMLGKLSWQLYRNIDRSMDYYSKAKSQSISFVGNKALRVGFLYQVHSSRIKAAIELACRLDMSSTVESAVVIDESCMDKDISDLELMNFKHIKHGLRSNKEGTDWCEVENDTPMEVEAGVNARLSRVKAIIRNALQGLRECRRLDQYHYLSVYRVAKVVRILPKISCLKDMEISEIHEVGLEGSLYEMYKLFERKRPQIVAIWCNETTSCRYEQLFQRTIKFDAIRRKYIRFYIDLLVEKGDIARIMELFCHAVQLRRKTAAVDEVVNVAAKQVLKVIGVEHKKRELSSVTSKESSKGMGSNSVEIVANASEGEFDSDRHADLLEVLYELYFYLRKGMKSSIIYPRVSSGKQSCTERLNEFYYEIEGLMVELFHPDYLTDEISIPTDSVSSLEEARALAEAWSPFVMVSFSVVADYCAKRWKSHLLTKPPLPPLILYEQSKSQSHQSRSPNKESVPKKVTLTKRQRVLKDQIASSSSCIVFEVGQDEGVDGADGVTNVDENGHAQTNEGNGYDYLDPSVENEVKEIYLGNKCATQSCDRAEKRAQMQTRTHTEVVTSTVVGAWANEDDAIVEFENETTENNVSVKKSRRDTVGTE